MFKKIKILIAFGSLSICLCLMSSTYSRYIVDATGNVEALFAKWQILVNEHDITNGLVSSIDFEPVIDENDYVASNVLAPSSTGYFDIDIDPSNVELSFKYTIDITIEDENIPDLIITKYSIIPDSYIEGDPIDVINLAEGTITNDLTFDKEIESFQFEPFTIRVYFEWYDGEGELMNDEYDSLIGELAATEDYTFEIKANISFEQIFG